MLSTQVRDKLRVAWRGGRGTGGKAWRTPVLQLGPYTRRLDRAGENAIPRPQAAARIASCNFPLLRDMPSLYSYISTNYNAAVKAVKDSEPALVAEHLVAEVTVSHVLYT